MATALIRKIIGGEKDHLNTLLPKIKPLIWNYLMRKAPACDAEDIYQETCIRIMNHIQDLKDPEKLNAWCLTLTQRAVVDYYRKKTYERFSDSEDFETFAGSQSEHDQLLLKKIRSCIVLLPEHYREIALLYFVLGCTRPEIETILEMNDNTVKSRISRSKPLIFQCVKEGL